MSQPVMLTVSASPQYFDRQSTSRLTWLIIASLSPAAIWGIAAYGPSALAVLAVAVFAALAAEWMVLRSFRRENPSDGSAVLTGLLIGMTMPPSVPIYIPLLASLFAIFVVKWPLGGRGSCWINPAAAAWAFAALCWPHAFTIYQVPQFFGAASASPAASNLVASWLSSGSGGASGPSDVLSASGFFHSPLDSTITDFLNRNLFSEVGAYLPQGYFDPFIGFSPAAIGQTSAVLLMFGSIFLISRNVVAWHTSITYFLSFAVLTYLFGGLPFGAGFASGDVLFFAVQGQFLFVLFFLATDFPTSPLTFRGRALYGLGLGLSTFLLNFIGAGSGTAIAAVLLMNIFVGAIDSLGHRVRS